MVISGYAADVSGSLGAVSVESMVDHTVEINGYLLSMAPIFK